MTKPPETAALKALTDWWDEMGVEADAALMRALTAPAREAPARERSASPQPTPAPSRSKSRPLETRVEEARGAAAGARTLDELAAAITAFDGCPLKAGAKSTVVCDGVEGAPIMVMGEGPGAEEDRTGKPFVGKAGQLLDRMLAAIGLSRETNVLITNVNYWRPPNNRNPEPDELAVCRPFVDRIIEVTAPKLILTVGAVPSHALLGVKTGIMRLRGSEKTYATPGGFSAPLFPLLHPAFLLCRPQEKSRAWRDLQAIEVRAAELGIAP